jgi:hypothetical protein
MPVGIKIERRADGYYVGETRVARPVTGQRSPSRRRSRTAALCPEPPGFSFAIVGRHAHARSSRLARVCIPTDEGTGFLDPGQHVDYDEAVAAVEKLELDGVGFVLLKGGGLIGADVDGCRNLKTGKIASWAKAVLDLKETYCEISPSGKGIHFFARGELPEASAGSSTTRRRSSFIPADGS